MSDNVSDLQEVVVAGEQVAELKKSRAWEEFIEPLLEKMITDIIGGKIDGRWIQAPIDESEADIGKLKYYLGYKAALIDLAKNIDQIVEIGEDAKLEIAQMAMQKEALESDYVVGGDYE